VCALSPEGDDSGEPALLPDNAKLCSWAGVESALFVHAWTVAVKSGTGARPPPVSRGVGRAGAGVFFLDKYMCYMEHVLNGTF
jgi:hypothetical protein